MTESEYEKKIGELQEKTLECGKLTYEIYLMLVHDKTEKDITKMDIVEDIMEDCRKAAQKVGWIDTRVFDENKDDVDVELLHDLFLEDMRVKSNR